MTPDDIILVKVYDSDPEVTAKREHTNKRIRVYRVLKPSRLSSCFIPTERKYHTKREHRAQGLGIFQINTTHDGIQEVQFSPPGLSILGFV